MSKPNYAFWNYILNDGKRRRPTRGTLNDLPPELRGLPQNKYGGHDSQRMKAFKGSKFGAANEGRTLSSEEMLKVEADLRRKGLM